MAIYYGDGSNSGSGRIVQVKSTTKTDGFYSTSSSFVDITGMSLSMTANDSSNKLIIMYYVHVSGAFWNYGNVSTLLKKDSTSLAISTHGSSTNATTQMNLYSNNAGNTNGNVSTNMCITETTAGDTSSHTYKVQARIEQTGDFHINGDNYHSSGTIQRASTSGMTIMEVAA